MNSWLVWHYLAVAIAMFYVGHTFAKLAIRRPNQDGTWWFLVGIAIVLFSSGANRLALLPWLTAPWISPETGGNLAIALSSVGALFGLLIHYWAVTHHHRRWLLTWPAVLVGAYLAAGALVLLDLYGTHLLRLM